MSYLRDHPFVSLEILVDGRPGKLYFMHGEGNYCFLLIPLDHGIWFFIVKHRFIILTCQSDLSVQMVPTLFIRKQNMQNYILAMYQVQTNHLC